MKTIQAIFYKNKCQNRYSFILFIFIALFTLLYINLKEVYLLIALYLGVIYIFIGF